MEQKANHPGRRAAIRAMAVSNALIGSITILLFTSTDHPLARPPNADDPSITPNLWHPTAVNNCDDGVWYNTHRFVIKELPTVLSTSQALEIALGGSCTHAAINFFHYLPPLSITFHHFLNQPCEFTPGPSSTALGQR